ncbi:MAG: DUF4255 domain-containing protein [Methylococcaceae bacterium]|nr:DUF4255 domain-containing protein [Methylococcaceae bacterium]
MALNPLGVLDLSNITDLLKFNLEDYWKGNPTKQPPIPVNPLWESLGKKIPSETFNFYIGGEMPLELRSGKEESCQVSIYLFHVEQDKYQRNSPVTGPYSSSGASRVPAIPYQPLSLDLYYLVTAHSKNYREEQRAMSIALRYFHEHPIQRGSIQLPGIPGGVNIEFSITMESEADDTMSRLWQSFTAPFRMGVVYKVSVVFITPPAKDKPIAPNPQFIELTANPAALPFVQDARLAGTTRVVTYASLNDPPLGQLRQIFRFQQDPATIVPADPLPAGSPLSPPSRLYLQGFGLNPALHHSFPVKPYRLYLILPDNSEIEVTQWKTVEPPPAKPGDPPKFQTDSQMVLDLPNTVNAIPDATHAPLPNIYRLRVGWDLVQDQVFFRSNAVPFSVAAWISAPAYPASPILAPHPDGSYTLTGRGFIPGNTEVLLETVALRPAAGATLLKGEFLVQDSNTIIFIPSDAMPKGRFAVRVRVNHVESDPSLWIESL